MNVGRVIATILQDDEHLKVIHRPETNDESHAGICGMITDPLQVAADLAALVQSHKALYYAVD